MAIEPVSSKGQSPEGQFQKAIEDVTVGGNLTVGSLQQTVNIGDSQTTKLIYSDPLPDLRHFQGRKDELADLYGWLKDGAVSLIGVRGEGGIGKSTLTAKAFASCTGFQRKFLADVRTNTSITSLAGRALKELGVPLAQVQAIDDKDLPQRLLRHLQTGRYLLVIDNMESLLSPEGEWQSGYGEFLRGFQNAGSNSVLLLASREYPQRYFGWRRSQWLMVEKGLSSAEGAALLRGLEVEGDDDDLSAVSADVRGNPLALALVAGWIRQSFKPGRRSAIRLAEATDLFQLTGEHRGESDLSVNSVLGWSIDRLTDAQRHLLGQVSVFRGAFTVEAAQALVPEEGDVAGALSELERRSLVQELVAEVDDASIQYRLQPRIKNYATRIVADIKEAHELAIRYFRSQKKTEFSLTAPPEDFFESFEIFHHLIQLERSTSAAVLLTSLDRFFRRRGFFQLLVDMYEQLYLSWHHTTEIKNKKDYAAVCDNFGVAHGALGNNSQAIDYHHQSLAIRREIGDKGGIAASLGNLGGAYKSLGQYEQSIDYQEQSLAIEREIGDERGIAISLCSLGITYESLSQYEQSIGCQEQSLVISRKIGDQ
ncbi:MAG: tetratricopeptide repeat protein, partial [Cyanobacteria bacterium J06598_3]